MTINPYEPPKPDADHCEGKRTEFLPRSKWEWFVLIGSPCVDVVVACYFSDVIMSFTYTHTMAITRAAMYFALLAVAHELEVRRGKSHSESLGVVLALSPLYVAAGLVATACNLIEAFMGM